MRSNIFISLGAMAAMLAATACSSDGDDGNRPVPIVLTSTIGTTPTSRAAQSDLQSTQIAKDNNVGVWIVEDTNAETVRCDNKAYSADGIGKLLTNEIPYFPLDGTFVKIYAYAPRQASEIGLTSGTFKVPSEQTSDDAYIAADLLIGAPANKSINKSHSTVDISFNHKMAKIVLDFQSATDVICGTQITTCKLYNTATVNVKTGEVATDEATPATSFTTEIGNDRKAVLLLPEQTVASDVRLFLMTLSGTTIHYVTPAEITFESGKVYTYTMNVETSLQAIVPTGCSASPWGSGNASGGHIVVNQ